MNNKFQDNTKDSTMRLVKYISNSGIASRRKAGELVDAKRIKVNGKVCSDMSYQVKDSDVVSFDDQIISLEKRKVYVILNKPVGYVCTNEDVHAEQKAVDLIKLDDNIRLYSAGRLDKDSEGLIIFSNDGDFVAKVTHPSSRIFKRYEVTTTYSLTKTDFYNMTSGKMYDDEEFLKAERVEVLDEAKKLYLITLNEGKKREIRRMIRKCNNNRVVTLKRISIGKLSLGKLPVGEFRELSNDDIQACLKNL